MVNSYPLELMAACIQELSLVRDLPSLMFVVRTTARRLTGADGVSFILKDKDKCFYADEDAIGPLWKGQRFEATSCVSGWVMNNRKSVFIEDIYADNRVPHEAYRPTFVKSLAIVPIRTIEPLGAIGCYWARPYVITAEEMLYLQTLADVTSVAFEKLQLYSYLREKIGDNIVDSHHTADILFSPQKFLFRISKL